MVLPGPLISDIADGKCLPFIGAGFSMNAKLLEGLRMPDWVTLTQILAKDAGNAIDDTPLIIAERYERKFGRVQLIEAIRKALHPNQAKPGSAHSAFADLPFDTVYTTNFDLLIEEAYALNRKPFRSLVGELQLPFHGGQLTTTIIKMHGDLRHEEHIIMSKKDYDEYMERYPVIATHLSAMLITRTPLFIGYSLTDPEFNHIRNVIRSRLGKFERMAYVIQFNKSESEIEESFGNNIHIVSVPTSPTVSYDDALSEVFINTRKELDRRGGIQIREVHPEAFEPVKEEVVTKGFESKNNAAILETTSKLCFAMMPFTVEFQQVYQLAIKPAVEKAGLTSIKADEMLSVGAIAEQIRSAIQQSRLCVADITTTNPNVLYEIGIAHTIGKPTILLAQKGERLSFDIGHHRILFYDTQEDDWAEKTRKILYETINFVLGEEHFKEAEGLINAGNYTSAIALLSVTLEQTLNAMLTTFSVHNYKSPKGLSAKIDSIDMDKISNEERTELLKALRIRNKAVHAEAEPTKEDANFVFELVKALYLKSKR
jgi:hypothetical protein